MVTLEKVKPVLASERPAWPVVLAGAVFLYLWWLSTLLFGLAFVWHRYVRRSVANDSLRESNSYGFSPRRNGKNKGPCCNLQAAASQASKLRN
jgi:hypothetical protein